LSIAENLPAQLAVAVVLTFAGIHLIEALHYRGLLNAVVPFSAFIAIAVGFN